MTRSGSRPSFFNVSASSVSLTTMETAPDSRISRMVCCCGRISLPFGAAESIGTTRTIRSIGRIRSCTIYRSLSEEGMSFPINSFSSWILLWSCALTHKICSEGIWQDSAIESDWLPRQTLETARSALFNTTI